MTLLGVQEPRLSLIPDGDTARGDQAVEFARWCGLTLYPWQEDLLRDMCRTDAKGRWAAREVVTVVARQNGKGEVLVARELAGIYLFEEKTILHTAHFMDTAIDAQSRLWEVIESNPDLLYWWEDEGLGIPHKGKTNGKENITFPNDATVLFRTRTAKTGRGLSVDTLILDECFDLPNEIFAALGKLIRARESAQIIFISSPVNRSEHAHGAVFSAKRWAAIDGAKRTLFKEWSPAEGDDPFLQETWARCNPSLVDEGPGAQLVDIESDAESAKNSEVLRKVFMVESLASGDWYPRDNDRSDFVPVLPLDRWAAGAVERDVAVGEAVLAVEVSADGEDIAMVVAGRTTRGIHVQLVDEMAGFTVADVVGKIVRLRDQLRGDGFGLAAVVLDRDWHGNVLAPELMLVNIEPVLATGANVASAYAVTRQAVRDGTLTHDVSGSWGQELQLATLRDEGKKFECIDRYSGRVPALVAMTLAVWDLGRYAAESELGARKAVEEAPVNPRGTLPRFKTKQDWKGGVSRAA